MAIEIITCPNMYVFKLKLINSPYVSNIQYFIVFIIFLKFTGHFWVTWDSNPELFG